jgi:trk system potassium uptake protein TrkA
MSTSSIAGTMIRDIDFPEGVLVGAVQKGDKILKPTGAMRIEEGDVIVIFAMASDVERVEQLLQVSIDFF